VQGFRFITWLRAHGLSTEPVPVSAYVGSSKNLKDLKESITWHRVPRCAYCGAQRSSVARKNSGCGTRESGVCPKLGSDLICKHIIYKLGFNQNYYTFTLLLLIRIALCSKFP